MGDAFLSKMADVIAQRELLAKMPFVLINEIEIMKAQQAFHQCIDGYNKSALSLIMV